MWSINAQSNVQLRYFQVLKKQERLHNITKATTNHFRGFKTLGNVKPVCLKIKFTEASIERQVGELESKKLRYLI